MMNDLTPAEIEALARVIERSPHLPNVTESPISPETGMGRGEEILSTQFLQLHETPSMQPQQQERIFDDISIQIEVLFGRTKLTLHELLQLQAGAIITLDEMAGEPVEIKANGRLIGHGEVVVVEGHFGVRISSFIGPVGH